MGGTYLHQVWAAPPTPGMGCTYAAQVWAGMVGHGLRLRCSGMDGYGRAWAAPTLLRYGRVWSGMGYTYHHQVWSGMGCTYAEQVWQEPTLNRYGTYTIISRYVFRIYFLKVGRADGAESELEHPP